VKIVELKAENVKRLRVAEIKPDGSMVVIGGKNGQGKSSLLDSIAYVLSGGRSLPDRPVREGEERAEIVATLDSDPPLVIRRQIRANGKTTLTVSEKRPDGTEAKLTSPQKVLDAMVGEMAFDPLAFTRMRPQEQIDLLKKIVGVDLSELDEQIKELMEQRRDVNRDADRIKAAAESMPMHPDAPAEKQSVSELLAQLDEIREHNRHEQVLEQQRRDAVEAFQESESEVESCESRIRELAEQLRLAQEELVSLEKNRDERKVAMEAAADAYENFERKDEDAILAQVKDLEATNQKVAENKARAEKMEEAACHKKLADDLTDQIEALRKQRTEALNAAKWPVEGLGMSDNGVTFNGLPFEQCSSAEQLRISTAIGLSQNPKLPVLLIRDGSLLDEDSLRMLGEIAEEHDAQVWVERVSSGDECSVIIEDGSVVSASVEGEVADATA
jgi:recombinational DNA repair ATPase RecF